MSWQHSPATANSSLARTKRAREFYASVLPIIKEMKGAGCTLEEIANELNERGFVTSQGKSFHKVAVHRLLKSNGYRSKNR